MSIEEASGEIAEATPALRLVLAADGAVVATGRADFIPDDGQRVIEVADDHYAAFVKAASEAGDDDEITYDERAESFVARKRAKSQAERDQDTTRALVVQTAQSAVGVNLAALTAGQRNALVAVLLHKAGALTPTGDIRPLAEWAR